MKYLTWLLRAAIFFALFAFALNNQQDVTVHFFLGRQWRAPLVLVVLAAFTLGLVVGVLGMLPRWLHLRQRARAAQRQAREASAQAQDGALPASAAALAAPQPQEADSAPAPAQKAPTIVHGV